MNRERYNNFSKQITEQPKQAFSIISIAPLHARLFSAICTAKTEHRKASDYPYRYQVCQLLFCFFLLFVLFFYITAISAYYWRFGNYALLCYLHFYNIHPNNFTFYEVSNESDGT